MITLPLRVWELQQVCKWFMGFPHQNFLLWLTEGWKIRTWLHSHHLLVWIAACLWEPQCVCAACVCVCVCHMWSDSLTTCSCHDRSFPLHLSKTKTATSSSACPWEWVYVYACIWVCMPYPVCACASVSVCVCMPMCVCVCVCVCAGQCVCMPHPPQWANEARKPFCICRNSADEKWQFNPIDLAALSSWGTV